MSFAIVTPTYFPDFDRCRFLIESSNKFLKTPATHYLVIDKKDFTNFKRLSSKNVKLVLKEDILPERFRQLPFLIRNKSVWIDIRGKIVRGWIIQQIVKLTSYNFIKEKNIVFMDSDEFFIRDTCFHDIFIKDGRLRLFRGCTPCNFSWANTIAKLLGIEVSTSQKYSFVGHPVTWNSEVLCQLQNYLSFRHGDYWPFVIARHWHFSEYQLYGVFAEHIADTNKYHHISSNELSLMHKWNNNNRPPVMRSNDLDNFFSQDDDFNFCMISSTSKTPLHVYENYVKQKYF